MSFIEWAAKPVALGAVLAVSALSVQAADIAVITGAAWASDSTAIAIQQAGRPVMLGTFGLGPSVLNRIRDGTQKMAIDQQPYLQSSLAATMLAANIDFGVELATDPVLTGAGHRRCRECRGYDEKRGSGRAVTLAGVARHSATSRPSAAL